MRSIGGPLDRSWDAPAERPFGAIGVVCRFSRVTGSVSCRVAAQPALDQIEDWHHVTFVLATRLRRRQLSVDLEDSKSLILEQLTWPEVELALTRGMTSAVIPVGAVEQHGPHLPLFVDAERGTALGLRVARHLGDALLAPTIRVGWSEHHMGFAGTISLRKETLEAVIRDYCESLARHGFQDIYLVPTHGGNFQPIEDMLPRLQSKVAVVNEFCRVTAYTDLLEFVSVWRWVVEEEVGLGRNVGGHADIAESSEMLYLHPGLVRMGRAEKGRSGVLDAELVAKAFEKGLRAITPNGVLGDPAGMDPHLGERLLDATALLVAEKLREDQEQEEGE